MSACNRVGVCPRLLVTAWASGVIGAEAWWQQGALGVSYLEAPTWLHHAFGLIGSERIAASEYKRALEKG